MNQSLSNRPLNNRTALVTGGSRGIGRGIALALARAGADVAINYRSDAAAAAQVVDEIRDMGRKASAFHASVADYQACADMMSQVADTFGGLSILINNGGIASRGLPVADTDPLEFERVMRTHAFGPHYLSKLALPLLRVHDRSDIIMISSTATLQMAPYGAPYNMGKAAAEALALTLAKEERANGVRVNIVAPSLTVSDMGSRLAKAIAGVDDIHALDAKSPFGRVSTPEDVAAAVLWLASDANSYVTGQKINIDGGGPTGL